MNTDLTVSFVQPTVRQLYEQQPGLLTGEIESLSEQQGIPPLVIIDEIQKIPEILNVAQDLIDRNIAKFILTGSSARKLYANSKVNLLPGRVVTLRLDPFTSVEIKSSLMDLLLYGSLPGIVKTIDYNDKDIDLNSYVISYLEEEIRAEALVRNVGFFARFLYLAASESGNIVNFRKLSQEIGIAHTTIISYYQILEDCLIVERFEPFLITKTRRKLIKACKYVFFDLGVRRLCAKEGAQLPKTYLGNLFEQFIGLELIRLVRSLNLSHKIKIYFWRDVNGQEIDWIIAKDGLLIPIETKYTDRPKLQDAKYLQLFQTEYQQATNAYIVCRVARKTKLADKVYAIPWQDIADLVYN